MAELPCRQAEWLGDSGAGTARHGARRPGKGKGSAEEGPSGGGPIAFACSRRVLPRGPGPLVRQRESALAVDLAAYGLVITRGTPPRKEGCRTAGRGLIAVTRDLAGESCHMSAAGARPRSECRTAVLLDCRTSPRPLTRCWRPPSAPGPACAAPESIDSAARAIPAAICSSSGAVVRRPGPPAPPPSSAAPRPAPGPSRRPAAGGRRPRCTTASRAAQRLHRRPARCRRRAGRRLLATLPSRTTHTREVAVVVSSSRPSSPRKTSAEEPRSASTPAMIGAIRASATPGRLGA